MCKGWFLASLMAGIALALPAPVEAQQAQAQVAPRMVQAQRTRPPQPELRDEEKITPAQAERAQEPLPSTAPDAPPRAAPKAAAAAPAPAQARAVACSGAFAKESSHLKLAQIFNSLNLTFTEVDGPEGSKVMASVLFPKDPKRRLEVWWDTEAGRSDTSLIVINGQSTWTGPKGLRLGMALAAIEKLNGKPFKLKGFDKSDGGSTTDWQGGALGATFPGGCKVAVRFDPDPKVPAEARKEVSVNTEFQSNDEKLKAAKPVVGEIILGYPK